MKTYLGVITLIAALATLPTHAQPGRRGPGGFGGQGPQFSGPMSKFFGENREFSAALEMQTKDPQGNEITIPGKLAFSDGNARFEMDMANMAGKNGGAAAAQMKAMGMDRMVVISRPDKKVTDMVYPGMNAYLEMPIQDPSVTANAKEDYKLETTELGKETIDGHPCIKSKAVVTDKKGDKHEATIWSATDLRKFPIRIEQNENGQNVTMLFKNVQFSKPDAKNFEAPAEYKKYGSMPEMMQEIMMKRYGGQGGFTPPPPPK